VLCTKPGQAPSGSRGEASLCVAVYEKTHDAQAYSACYSLRDVIWISASPLLPILKLRVPDAAALTANSSDHSKRIMEDGSGASRPKRRCSSRAKASAAPSAVHYVGYVEEDETPEAIMKKFEELDKVHAAGDRRPNDEAFQEGAFPNFGHVCRLWQLGKVKPARPKLQVTQRVNRWTSLKQVLLLPLD